LPCHALPREAELFKEVNIIVEPVTLFWLRALLRLMRFLTDDECAARPPIWVSP
jgi:hypothetical protein